MRALRSVGVAFAALVLAGCGSSPGAGNDGPPPAQLALLAGATDGPGSQDGVGPAARFLRPGGVALDRAGNVIVADFGNSTVRKVAPGGAVTTLAGVPEQVDVVDGPGSAARFTRPAGVATDNAGNVYVAEHLPVLRRISPAGVVTTWAGVRTEPGHADGTLATARFSDVSSVAVDAADNVYVIDRGNRTVRMITPAGAVTTIAGGGAAAPGTDGPGLAVSFAEPAGLAADGAGNLYLADASTQSVRKIAPDRFVSTLAANVPGAPQRFRAPEAVAVDGADNVYVADPGYYRISRVTPAGAVSTVANWSVSGSNDGLQFASPIGLASDTSGNLVVSDPGSDTVRTVSPAGAVATLAGSAPVAGTTDATGAAARFGTPSGLAADRAGNVYVADYANATIRKVTPAGVVSTFAGQAGQHGHVDGAGAVAQFDHPVAVATDAGDNVYVADQLSNTIRKITPQGQVSTLAGSGAMGTLDGAPTRAQFWWPAGLAVDGAGNVYVADGVNSHRIRKVTPAGDVTTIAGSSTSGYQDGNGAAATFGWPDGVAVDALGNVYVADRLTLTLRKIAPGGDVTTLAGAGGRSGITDGTGAAARFSGPRGLTIDGDGNLYVADGAGSVVRKVTPAGVVTTVVGRAHEAGFVAGALPGRIAYPVGVAMSGRTLLVSMANAILRVSDVP